MNFGMANALGGSGENHDDSTLQGGREEGHLVANRESVTNYAKAALRAARDISGP
jgi:hypothetical protein